MLPPSSSAISPATSFCLCAFFTFSYVGSLYLARAGRLAFRAPPVNVPNGQERVRAANEQWRNDPNVIRARLKAAVLSTFLSCAVLAIVVDSNRHEDSRMSSLRQVAITLGLSSRIPHSLRALVFPHILTPAIFAGPLYAMYLSMTLPLQSRWSWKTDVVDKFTSIQGLRNFVVAPITEELVFRSCIVSAMKLSGASNSKMIFIAPLWFGIAHVHHAWELYNIYGKTRSALQRAILTCLIQLAYTTLFGWFTTWLFVVTGYIYPAITSHVFCNIMGLPSPSFDARTFPKRAAVIWMLHVGPLSGFLLSLYQNR